MVAHPRRLRFSDAWQVGLGAAIPYACSVARSAAYERSWARAVRICDSAGAADPRTLRQRLLAEIRQVVGFDAFVWLLTDPETSVGAAPLADVPPGVVSGSPLVRPIVGAAA